MEKCNCYHDDLYGWLDEGKAHCYGTKEIEICHCGGDKSKCDFYPEYRKENKNIMKYDIKIGDYVETIDGIIGYVNRICEEDIYWIVTNNNNVSGACAIGEESGIGLGEMEHWYKRIGKYEFNPTLNVIEPLEDRGTAYMNYNTVELYRVYNKVNEIIKYINEKEKSDSDA